MDLSLFFNYEDRLNILKMSRVRVLNELLSWIAKWFGWVLNWMLTWTGHVTIFFPCGMLGYTSLKLGVFVRQIIN